MNISVIVPTHNRPQSCSRLLAALMPQVLTPDIAPKVEVIIVDDNSRQCFQNNLNEMVNGYPERSVRLITRKICGGPSAARNSGIAAANGDLLAFLDDDCIPGESYISETIRLHTDYPQVLIINGNLSALRDDSISRFWFHYYSHAFNRDEGELYQVQRLSSGIFSMKRSLLVHFNPLFDEALPSREDYDLYLRLNMAGIPVFKADSIHALIECRQTLFELLRQRRWYQRGETLLRKKYGESFFREIQAERYPRPSLDFLHINMLLYLDRRMRFFLERFDRK